MIRHVSRSLILVFFLVSTNQIFAQNRISKKDSILQVIDKETDPKKKVIAQSNYIINLSGQSIDSAEVYTDKLIRGYRKANDTLGLARMISMKAYVISFASRYEESLKLSRAAYELQSISKNDTAGLGVTLIRMGLCGAYFKRYSEAVSRTEEALNYFKMLGNEKAIDMALNNLGVFKTEQQDYEGAIKYYKKSEAIRLRLNEMYWVGYSRFNIAESFRALGETDSFDKYILLSESTFLNDAKTALPTMVKMSLAEYHRNNGDIRKGISLIEQGIEYSTKTGNTEMVDLATSQLADFYFADGQYKKAYETRIAYDSMQHVTDSINNAARVTEIEEKYENAKNKAEIEELKVAQFEAEKGTRRVAIIMASLLGLAILIGFRIWSNAQKKQIVKEKEQFELEAKLQKTKLLALKSQMNPHFIFNSINIAQSYILEANKEKAYMHMEKFAKLLRLILDSSDKILIPIEDELAMVRLYLELEHNRFADKFNYQFHVDEELNDGIYEIPGMIIQPFVENALIHGVLNLENGDGSISVNLTKEKEQVHCIIEDNGVGRVAAKHIKEQKGKHLRSIAIYNIEERLNIISQQTGQQIEVKIVDLYEGQNVSGTRVSFFLPLE